MTTGAIFVNLPNKHLTSAEDFQDRFVGYLRKLNQDTTKALWNVDGVFDTKLTLTSALANSVTVNGTQLATDGIGHLLDVNLIYPSRTALFENTNAISYHVGFKYAEVPSGIILNPRTGHPEYRSYKEIIGESATPGSVVDNGNNTITFNVNSVTESGVTNAGRVVRVFKVVPDVNGLTEVIAIEDCTVAYAAGNNTITTSGNLGQTVISTTAADYVVVLLGMSIKRNLDMPNTDGYFNIGIVQGNGAGNTPTIFGGADQKVLKTFQDASQITFVPYANISATNVQDAIEEVLDDYAGSGGAGLIGVDPTGFGAIADGGIGNVADSTYVNPQDLQSIIGGVDQAIRRHKVMKTVNDNNISSILADYQSVTLNTPIGTNSLLYLRLLQNAAAAPYTITSSVTSSGYGTDMLGETSDPNNASSHLRYTRIAVSDALTLSGGLWRRVYLDTTAGNGFTLGGASGKYGMQLNDFGINGGAVRVDSKSAEEDLPLVMRHGLIKPKAEATKKYASSLQLGGATNGYSHAIFEGMVIYGASTSQTTPATAKGAVNLTTSLVGTLTNTTAAGQPRPLVFRDCVFVQQRVDTPLINIEGDHRIVFENCVFLGINSYNGSDPLLKLASGCNVVFRDCLIFDPEGHTLVANGANGLFDNCIFVCGLGGSSAITSPQIIKAYAGRSLTFRNTKVLVGEAAMRTTGTPPAVIEFGDDTSHNLLVDGLDVRVVSGTVLPSAAMIKLKNAASDGMSRYNNLTFDFGGLGVATTNTEGIVLIDGNSLGTCSVDGVKMYGMNNPSSDTSTSIFVLGDTAVVRDLHLTMPSGAGTGRLYSFVKFAGTDIVVDGLYFQNTNLFRCQKAPVWFSGNFCRLEKVRKVFSETWDITGTVPLASVIYLQGSDHLVTDARLYITTSDSIPLINIACDDVRVSGCTLHTTQSTAVIHATSASNKRNSVVNNDIVWSATGSEAAIWLESTDSLVDSNIIKRVAGVHQYIDNAASGSITGDGNILAA